MVYVPILKTLEVLLNNDCVLSEIERGHNSGSDTLKDYCDGESFKSHPLFSKYRRSIQVLFYYDEVEICNPLGSSRGKHKLGMFYFLVGNLHPMYRSKTKVIQLAAVCKHKYIKKYSMNSVMEPIIKDMQTLEQGYEFNVQGSCRTFRGTIALVSADNPASAALGGFKESTGAHRLCRQCMGLTTEIKEKYSEDQFQLRTLDEHLDQIDEVEEDNTGEKSKEYGIKLAKRHQYLQCYQQLNKESLLQENVEIGPGMPVADGERPTELQFDDCYRANWIKVFGFTYKKECTICIGVDDDDLPIFAKFGDTYILQQYKPVAYARVYKTSNFNTHYHAFEVTPTSDFQVITLEYQEHPFPLHMRRLPSGTLVVVPKYHIYKSVQSCYC